MRQINPLYIILLLVVVLSFVLFKLMYAKAALHEIQSQYQDTKDMVHNIVEFRGNWEDSKRRKSTLGRILKSSMLKNEKVIKKEKRGVVQIHAPSLNSKAASYLSNRLLNEPFVIKTMKIQRLNREKVSLDVEISL